MKKKDILFLCQFFYPEYISSATLPFDTAVALSKAGFKVGALCGYPREYADKQEVPLRETVEGVDIHRVKYIQLSRKGFLGRLVNYFSITFMMALHIFEIAKYRTVVVYSNPPILPWVASWAKLFFGTKLVFVAYDLYPEIAVRTNTLREGSLICKIMDHINKVVYRRADSVITLSGEMKDYVLKNRKISDAKVCPIANWYADQGEPSAKSLDNSFAKLTKGRFVVSYFGNMGVAQDMQTIMDAVYDLKDDPDICFLFAGHGNKVDAIKEFVSKEGIQNMYLNEFLRGKEFQDALEISDAALVSLEQGLVGLCVPSKTYSYMMQGIPLLAIMDSCDIVSDIEQGAGKWIRNGEGEALANAIREMKNDPNAHVRMRDKCRTIYKSNYTTEICTEKYVKLFRELLKD